MDALLTFINHPLVPWGVALSILVLALLLWLGFSFSLGRVSRQLHKLQALVNGHNPESFAENYAEIDAYLQKHPFTARHWQAFRQTLPPRAGSDPVYYSVRPIQYFNHASLIAPHINLRLYQAVPNILVGLGIWFTFLGLVAALWFASQGVTAADVTQAQQSLRDLLHAATFKFVTSMAGLMASIVFSWAEKTRLYSLNKQLERFCRHLEYNMVLRTTEQVQVLQLQETQKQSQQLASLQKQLQENLGQQLSETLGLHLQQAVLPLAQSIDGLGGKISSLNQDALTELLQRFSQQVQGAAGTELKQMADTLQHLVFTLNEFKQGFEHAGNGVGTQIQHAASTFNTVQSSFAEVGDELLQRLAHTSSELHQTSQNLHTASAPLAETAKLFQQSQTQLQQLLETLHHSSTILSQTQQESAQHLQATQQQVQQVWQSYQQRFSEVDEDLGLVFKELSRGLDSYRQQVEQFTSRLDDSLNQSVKALNGVIGELVEALEEWQNRTRKQSKEAE